MTEDTVQRLMGLADAFARACFDTDGGAHDARSTLESAIREALAQGEVQGLTDAEIRDERTRTGANFGFMDGARWAECTLCAKNGLKLKEQDHD
jgi:nucleoside-triphosphatase THEP1